jgi:hypothetical protein
MVAGADSIDDMDLLRHGGMGRLFTGIRAPSTLGTFLRSFTFGHVRQLDAVASRFVIALAKNAPILAGADQGCYVDIDDTIKATYGYAKAGAGHGYCADLRIMPTLASDHLLGRESVLAGRHNPTTSRGDLATARPIRRKRKRRQAPYVRPANIVHKRKRHKGFCQSFASRPATTTTEDPQSMSYGAASKSSG